MSDYATTADGRYAAQMARAAAFDAGWSIESARATVDAANDGVYTIPHEDYAVAALLLANDGRNER